MDVWLGFFVLAIGLLMARALSASGVDLAGCTAFGGDCGSVAQCVNAEISRHGGHGKGCNEADDDAFTLLRRRFRKLPSTVLCSVFAATVVATGYHYVAGWEAPYPFFSLPVIARHAGRYRCLYRLTGLLWLNLRRSPLHGDTRQNPMDRGFILLLL